MITPLVESLELVTGRRLSTDVAQQVKDGLIDPKLAADVSKNNLRTSQLEQQAVSDRQQEQQRSQREAITNIQNTVVAVESAISSRDPDYSRKQPFIMDRVRVLIAERQPKSPADARKIVEDAHREVSERMKPLVQERRPVTSVSSGNSSTNARPTPTTLEEVIRGALV